MTTVSDRVRQVVARVSNIDEVLVTEDTHIHHGPEWDSLDFVEAPLMLEREYGVDGGAREFSEDMVSTIQTVGDLINFARPGYLKVFFRVAYRLSACC